MTFKKYDNAKQRSLKPLRSHTNGNANGPGNRSQWQQRYEQYRNLAQNVSDGDAVARENYWQHAEHFYRMMNSPAELP